MAQFVRQAIARLTDGHSLLPGLDYDKAQDGNCRLRSGIETSFVPMLANVIAQTPEVLKHQLAYHHLFYLPSRSAEHSIGYDLSIGRSTSQQRVRTMHKALAKWCDARWSWRIAQNLSVPETDRQHQEQRPRSEPRRQRLERLFEHYKLPHPPKGDYRHLLTLLDDYQNHPHLQPYLVLHICYCIHDYRRMGMSSEDRMSAWVIPGPESLLRTVVIDLGMIVSSINNWAQLVCDASFKLKIIKNTSSDLEDNSPQQYLEHIANADQFEVRIYPGGIPLPGAILSVKDLADRVAVMLNH